MACRDRPLQDTGRWGLPARLPGPLPTAAGCLLLPSVAGSWSAGLPPLGSSQEAGQDRQQCLTASSPPRPWLEAGHLSCAHSPSLAALPSASPSTPIPYLSLFRHPWFPRSLTPGHYPWQALWSPGHRNHPLGAPRLNPVQGPDPVLGQVREPGTCGEACGPTAQPPPCDCPRSTQPPHLPTKDDEACRDCPKMGLRATMPPMQLRALSLPC